MRYAMIDLYCRSYDRPPAAFTFDIDDTCDVAHGQQQLALFHTRYDERCFLPIHVYDAANARPVVVLFRPGKTPSGEEIRGHLRRIRRHWPHTRITVRGDSAARCSTSKTRCDRRTTPPVDAPRLRRAEAQANAVRRHTEVRYGAKYWRCQRPVAARIEATPKGLDFRYVVTNLTGGSPEWLYETLYCARGQMEDLIKLHKTRPSWPPIAPVAARRLQTK
jgi:hypothetical protein